MTPLKSVIFAAFMATAISLSASAQTPTYKVTTEVDKKADFSKIKSYTWDPGWHAFDKTVHAQIVAAVDRELGTLGLEKRTAPPSDVLVRYASVRRTDVDLKSKPTGQEGGLREYPVGSLVVFMLDAATQRQLFRTRVDTPIDVADREKVEATINSVVAQMFAKYPTRSRK